MTYTGNNKANRNYFFSCGPGGGGVWDSSHNPLGLISWPRVSDILIAEATQINELDYFNHVLYAEKTGVTVGVRSEWLGGWCCPLDGARPRSLQHLLLYWLYFIVVATNNAFDYISIQNLTRLEGALFSSETWAGLHSNINRWECLYFTHTSLT